MPLTADTSEPLLITGSVGVTDMTFRQLRQLTQAFGDGVMGATDMLVTAPGGMNVQVAAGYAMVTGDTITGPSGQHRYGVPLTSAKTLGTVAAPSGATRRDSIVCQVYDEGDAPGAGLNVGRVEYRVNPSESTTPEALPNGAELLAYCDVTVGAVAITSAMLKDMRKAARPMRQVLDDVQALTATGTINPAGGRLVTFTGAAAQTLTLPPAQVGAQFEIWNLDTSDAVTVARAGTDTIGGGVTSIALAPGASVVLVCLAAGVWRPVWDRGEQVAAGYNQSTSSSAGAGNKASITVAGDGITPMKLTSNMEVSTSADGTHIVEIRDNVTNLTRTSASVPVVGGNRNASHRPEITVPAFTGSKTFHLYVTSTEGSPTAGGDQSPTFLRATWEPGHYTA